MSTTAKAPVVAILGLALLSRAAAVAVGAAVVLIAGFPAGEAPRPNGLWAVALDLPARWDTGWYVGIASGGYRWDGQAGQFENIAFFPAFPLLLGRAAELVGAQSETAWNWTGVALSTILFGVALLLLWRVARRFMDEDRSWLSVVLCASSPFAVFFGLPYSESLYLASALAMFYAFEQRYYALSIIAGVFVGATRPLGVVFAGALMCALAIRLRRAGGTRPMDLTEIVSAGAAALGPVMGAAVYSAYVYALTGHPLMWAIVQEGWGRPTQNPLLALWSPIAAVLSRPVGTVVERPHDVLNALAGMAALAAVPSIARRLGVAHGVVVAGGVAVPLVAGGVASLGRYTAVLFPIFLWLGAVLPQRWRWLVVGTFVALQAVVAGLFFTWRPMY